MPSRMLPGQQGGGELRVDVTGVRRQGKVSTLTWRVTNVGAASDSWYVGSNFGTSIIDFATSGVSLIDPVNAKRCRVARNGPGEDADCVCTSGTNKQLKGGSSLEYYAVYGAPPANVSKVNVELADLGCSPMSPFPKAVFPKTFAVLAGALIVPAAPATPAHASPSAPPVEQAKGFGEARPKYPNIVRGTPDEENRKRNRRVEIIFTSKQ